MTRTLQLTVGPDGRVTVPGVRPGQTVTVEIDEASETPERLTLGTARTAEERDAIAASIIQAAREFRLAAGADDERLSLTHGDLLYDENGLPN